MKFFALLLLFLFSGMQSKASVWIAQNSWSEDWEKKYSAWIESSVGPKFLKNLEITTDCADAVIALRWIFSRQNLLPAASTTSKDKIISNLSSDWDGVPTDSDWKKDKRFLSALKDINNLTDTKTLFRDLYPVKLIAKFLTPGTVFANATQTSGHAEWIAKTSFDGINSPIVFYSSTVPQQVREFLIYPFMKVKWPEKNKNGFMKFRWAVVADGKVILKASEALPGYSLEQYELAASADLSFDDFIAERLTGQPLDGIRKLNIFASHLAERIENRIPVVKEGFEVCGGGKCPVKNASSFYNYSTYSRDGEILLLIQGIFELIYSNRYLQNVDDQMAGRMTVMWSQLQTDISFEIQGQKLSLGQIVSNFNSAKYSSDPNLSIERRWGL